MRLAVHGGQAPAHRHIALRAAPAALLLLAAACGNVSVRESPDGGGDGADIDSGPVGDAGDAAPVDSSTPDGGAFCVWQPLEAGLFAAVNGPDDEESAALTDNGLIIYYTSFVKGSGQADIYDAGRKKIGDPFGGIRLVSELASESIIESEVEISASGDEIFFIRDGVSNILSAARTTPQGPFGQVTSTELAGHSPSISRDSLRLYFLDELEENVMRAERSAPGEPWINPTMVGEAGAYFRIDVSRDELHLLMGGGSGTTEPMVAIASRESVDQPFGPPISAGGPLDNSDLGTLSDVSWGPGDFQIIVSVDTPDGGDLYASDCLPSDQVPTTSE